jgi:hypothetical protein
MTAGVRAGEHEVLAPQGHSAQRTFNGIVVDFDATIPGEHGQGILPVEGVLNGASQGRFRGQRWEQANQPSSHVIEQWLGLRSANVAPSIGWLTTYLCLNCIQLADPAERFAGNGRGMRLTDVVELPAHMRLM